MEYVGVIVSGVSAIVVAMIGAFVSREQKNNKEERIRIDRRAQIRAQESQLSMELMFAGCALSLVTAKKLNGKYTNGDVEMAIDNATRVQAKYEDFVREIASRQVTKG